MVRPDGSTTCPICELWDQSDPVHQGLESRYECKNCGPFILTSTARTLLSVADAYSKLDRARLAYAIRHGKTPTVGSEQLDRWKQEVQLRGPLELIDEVVLLFCGTVKPGQPQDLNPAHLPALFGAENSEAVAWAIDEAKQLGLIRPIGSQQSLICKATTQGWRRYEELMRAGSGSKHAFMAMAFNDPVLRQVLNDHMKPAVRATGFELRAADEEHQKAGSIHDQMRVDIRTSRFVVCDLTHGNRGAYWEAGFAEGIGRPVFFTCRKDVFDDASHPDHPHFDTANQKIITWDPDDLRSFKLRLTAAIRATLFTEALPEDPQPQ